MNDFILENNLLNLTPGHQAIVMFTRVATEAALGVGSVSCKRVIPRDPLGYCMRTLKGMDKL